MLYDVHQLDAAALNDYVQAPDFGVRLRALHKSEQQPVLNALAETRLGDLDIASRTRLIRSVQHGATRKRHELAILAIFLGTHGKDLTDLKRGLDRTDDHRDLDQLIFHDIDHLSIRKSILEHIRVEGLRHPSSHLRVISDLDDTVYRNWVDPRYPKRTVYPGVLELYRELGDLVLLTGRAGERTGTMERYYRKRLGALGIKDITMMTGTFVHQFVHPWVFSRKWRNLERHHLLFPEVPLVMFGDTGQADPEFLSEACERYPGEVKMALLHRVRPLSQARLERCQANGIVVFDSYVGAALAVFQAGLIDADAFRRVAESARNSLARIIFQDKQMGIDRHTELQRDLDEAVRLGLLQPKPESAQGAGT